MPDNKVKLPFGWLGQYQEWVGLAVVLVAGALLRGLHLDSLPPALYSGEARLGLEALKLVDHGWLPGLTAANGYAPLWVWLQASSVAVFGHTAMALRLWPALLGVLSVWGVWLWAREWFGGRIGWLAAFLMAVTPWAVTLSRNALLPALILVLVPFTFWAATLAVRRGRGRWWALAAALLVFDLLSGPVGWLLAATVLLVAGLTLWRYRDFRRFDRGRWAAVGVLAVGLGTLGYLVGVSWPALQQLSKALGLTTSFSQLSDSLLRTLLMFNLRGDENFRHNFAAQPMLNAFVGLMLVAGVLVAISRLQQRRYRVLLGVAALLLIPAVASTVAAPNAAHAVAALPAVLILAAVGISYMLELWYSTFPINSAARSTGQSVIIVLLLLTLFQGYTQYFRAWAASNETYVAYDEPANAAAGYLRTHPFNGGRYLVATSDELAVAAYLNDRQTTYAPIEAAGLTGLPVDPGARQFVITAAARDAAVKSLSLKFPGGKLRPQLSTFSQNEIYYVYEVTK